MISGMKEQLGNIKSVLLNRTAKDIAVGVGLLGVAQILLAIVLAILIAWLAVALVITIMWVLVALLAYVIPL